MNAVDIVSAFLGALLVVMVTTLVWLNIEERKRRAVEGGHEDGQPRRGG